METVRSTATTIAYIPRFSVPRLFALRAGKDRLPGLLTNASSARTKSIRLRGVDFAGELCSGLLSFAAEREADYTRLQKLVADGNEKEIRKMLAELAEKDTWFAQAEAGVS